MKKIFFSLVFALFCFPTFVWAMEYKQITIESYKYGNWLVHLSESSEGKDLVRMMTPASENVADLFRVLNKERKYSCRAKVFENMMAENGPYLVYDLRDCRPVQ